MRSPLLNISYNKKILKTIFIDLKQLKSNFNIYVDLGSGDGEITRFIADIIKPHNVICVDINAKALKKCLQFGFHGIKLDLNKDLITIASDSVDIVTAFEVIEHLYNKDNLLEEAFRVLKKGGFFILSTPNLTAWLSRILMLFGRPPFHYDVSFKYKLHKPSYGHVSLYTYGLLLSHLEAVGFTILKTQGLLMPWYKANKLVEVTTLLLSKIRPSLAPDILVVAQK